MREILGLVADVLAIDLDSPNVDLLASGLLDSVGLVELLAQLERRFDVQLPAEAFELEDLRSVQHIARLVTRQRAESRREPVGAPSGGVAV